MVFTSWHLVNATECHVCWGASGPTGRRIMQLTRPKLRFVSWLVVGSSCSWDLSWLVSGWMNQSCSNNSGCSFLVNWLLVFKKYWVMFYPEFFQDCLARSTKPRICSDWQICVPYVFHVFPNLQGHCLCCKPWWHVSFFQYNVRTKTGGVFNVFFPRSVVSLGPLFSVCFKINDTYK